MAAQAHSDVQFWDRFMLFRYPGGGFTFKKVIYYYSVPFCIPFRIAALQYQDTTEDGNYEWTHLRHAPAITGLVDITSN